METPSEILTKRITDRLVKEGLLIETEAEKARSTIALGKMRAEDWRLSIELATEKKKGCES